MKGQVYPKAPLTLHHEQCYYPTLNKDLDKFEGWPQHLVMATVDGYHIMFFVSAYLLDGKSPGGFLADNAATLSTIFVMIPVKEQGVMHDNDFIVNGFCPNDFLKFEDLKIVSGKDKVMMKIKDVEFVSAPPYFFAKGKDTGIEFDIKVTAVGETSWYKGEDWDDIMKDADKLAKKGNNFDQYTSVEGTIKAMGKTFVFKDGRGTHAHPVNQLNLEARMRSDSCVYIGYDKRLQFVGQSWAGIVNRGFIHLLDDGRHFVYDNGVNPKADANLIVTGTWYDPRSMFTVPYKWHANMRSPEGILDVDIAGTGRATRIFALKRAYCLDLWVMGMANGLFLLPNGDTLAIKDVLCALEFTKTCWP